MNQSKAVAKPGLGHRRLLLALYACELISLISLVTASSLRPSVFPLLFWAPGVITFAVIELVYRDASAINREKGSRVINATLWSLLMLPFSVVALPWYVFVRREEALSTENRVAQYTDTLGHADSISNVPGNQNFCPSCGQPTPASAVYCSDCGTSLMADNGTRNAVNPVRVSPNSQYYDMFLLSLIGSLLLFFGIVQLTGFNLFGELGTVSYSSGATSRIDLEIGTTLAILGLAFISIAIVNARRRLLSDRSMPAP
jgi:hypothetical protein